MNGVLWNSLSFLLAIAILVTFHEWGHFLFARLFKVDVLRFSIGFGKPLLRRTGKHGTEYVLAALPLGGYVKMLDEREGPVASERLPYAFNQQTVLKRFLIVLAGPLFNFIFAIVAYWAMFVVGIEQTKPIIGEVAPQSIAAKANLQAKDQIVAINGEPTASWREVIENLIVYTQAGDSLTLTTQSPDGNTSDKQLTLLQTQSDGNDLDPIQALGIKPYRPSIPPVLDSISAGEAAAQARLRSGDTIVKVNDQAIDDWTQLVEIVRASPNRQLSIHLLREGKPLQLSLTPKARVEQGETIGFIGVTPQIPKWPDHLLQRVHQGPLDAMIPALKQTWSMTQMTAVLLYKMLTGAISASSISGPIGIAQGAGASAANGFSHYLNFLGLISVSLAILNLLPIPVLDGGHLFYYLIEMLRGRPVSMRVQEAGFTVGLLVIIGLMAFAFYNDIMRLFT